MYALPHRAKSCLLRLTWKMEMTVSRLECHIWGEVTAHDFKGQDTRKAACLIAGVQIQFSSVQSLSCVWLFVTPWTAACQASLSITNSQSSLKLMSIKSVMPSSHLILCHPLLFLPLIPPSIRVFSNESVLCIRWPNTGVSALASVLPKNTKGWSPLEWTGWISLQSKRLSRVFSSTTVQKHQFFSTQLSSQSNSHIHTWPLEKP